MLLKNKVNLNEIDNLYRLSMVSESGMGALRYFPENHLVEEESSLNLDEIARECANVFDEKGTKSLDELFCLGGSSGGARPKVYYIMDGEEWIVKFPSSMDMPQIGRQEYEYSLCAKKCGIEMPETRLISSNMNSGYFAVKRFDRKGEDRIHMVSAGGLLETSHRIPNLDYHTLMQLTMMLTKDYKEIEKLFRLMCFNVFAHNRDDHAKNFSFIHDGNKWKLSPAYDLTYCNSIGGEHATTIAGNGKNPGNAELLEVARQIKFNENEAKQIIEEIRSYVGENLGEYLEH